MSIDQHLAAARTSLQANTLDAASRAIAEAWRQIAAPELLELACALAPPSR